MSIENAERFVRFLREDAGLLSEVQSSSAETFEAVSAGAGASCSAHEAVLALAREIAGG